LEAEQVLVLVKEKYRFLVADKGASVEAENAPFQTSGILPSLDMATFPEVETGIAPFLETGIDSGVDAGTVPSLAVVDVLSQKTKNVP
jgi:hypothetical protein